jgi:hypothetical protein
VNVTEIYAGSNGEATKQLYAELEKLGPKGIVALNLFRACKASERAKKYRSRYKGLAYEKKNWSIGLLCAALVEHPGLTWGWKKDPAQEFHCWVLYVELPTGQVSFHASAPIGQPTCAGLAVRHYPGEWDGQHLSAARIVAYVQHVLDGTTLARVEPKPTYPELAATMRQENLL